MDIAGIETLLTDEERAVRDRVRSWVEDEGVVGVMAGPLGARDLPVRAAAGARRARDRGRIARPGTGARGGTTSPTASRSRRSHGHPRSLATTVHVQSGLAMTAIWMHGSDEQKERWLPAMARFEAIGAFAATEPEAGSDLGSLQTSARSVEGGYALNGEKRWIGHGTVCDVAVVWARSEDGRVDGFLVEKGAPGWSAEVIAGKGSQRAVWQAHIVMGDCRVPAESRLPGVGGLGRRVAGPDPLALRRRVGCHRPGARLLRGGAGPRPRASSVRRARWPPCSSSSRSWSAWRPSSRSSRP